jgi:hypothetical protein
VNAPRVLTLVGLLGALATGVAIYVANPGTTKADLLDAGVGACPAVDAICPARRPKQGGGYEYARIRVKARDCRAQDGFGFILPPAPGGGEWFRVDLCQKAATDVLVTETDSQDEPFDCACSSGSQCKVPNPDGGANINAPLGETLGPGYRFQQFGGAGCVPKSCGALANGGVDDSWPAGCPQ